MQQWLLAEIVTAIAAGLAIGVVHFAWLHRGVQQLPTREGTGRALLAGAFARLSVSLVGFALIARFAAHPGIALIGALGGFVIARSISLRIMHRSEI